MTECKIRLVQEDDIEILYNESLGNGGFGEVYKAIMGGDYCAAKVILQAILPSVVTEELRV